jgi:hypothetical protein
MHPHRTKPVGYMEIFIASADRRALTLEIPAQAITAWIRAYLGEGQ